MVRYIYSFILKCSALVSVPVVITLFFPIRRKEYDFMELQLVREQFQSDMIGEDNFRSVEIEKV